MMHKKAKKPHEAPRLVALEKRRPANVADEVAHRRQLFPLLEARAKEEAASAQPSERARLRAATVARDQREAQTRRILYAADRPAPTVREELDAPRSRPRNAPMATRATRERAEPQPPAGYHPPVAHITATPSLAATIASIALVIGCIGLAAWLGQP